MMGVVFVEPKADRTFAFTRFNDHPGSLERANPNDIAWFQITHCSDLHCCGFANCRPEVGCDTENFTEGRSVTAHNVAIRHRRRSAKRKRGSAQPQEIDRRYSSVDVWSKRIFYTKQSARPTPLRTWNTYTLRTLVKPFWDLAWHTSNLQSSSAPLRDALSSATTNNDTSGTAQSAAGFLLCSKLISPKPPAPE